MARTFSEPARPVSWRLFQSRHFEPSFALAVSALKHDFNISNSYVDRDAPLANGSKEATTVRQYLVGHRDVKPLAEVQTHRTRYSGMTNTADVANWATLDASISLGSASASASSGHRTASLALLAPRRPDVNPAQFEESQLRSYAPVPKSSASFSQEKRLSSFIVGTYNDAQGTESLIKSLPKDSLAAISLEPMQMLVWMRQPNRRNKPGYRVEWSKFLKSLTKLSSAAVWKPSIEKLSFLTESLSPDRNSIWEVMGKEKLG
ncbi:hypothetical protein Z517_09363 [Fonsecaea pedrosoi CBS 271.37]|uniref:Uncharacterized protein n=1 Tax=Fonsecaea pedrosoi CBS 271.37 TaxID=1442368 RepID=A0A0D2GX60_9EURO|nr:uncharacterized protein Z517_09363 [Fonsecaea pedrosoi CBS 271.37]KIW76919.1 hypothetical protein Z517_09363 [Fonsecaea pedrosoi CBS 271.37]